MSKGYFTQFNRPKSKGFEFKKSSLTQQSFKYESDINNIVRDQCCSSLPPNQQRPVFNTRFSVDSYSDALNAVAEAKSQFESLPSHIRKRFHYNPQELLEFVGDDKNYNEAVKLGLIEKPKDYYTRPVEQNKPSSTVTVAPPDTVNEASSH